MKNRTLPNTQEYRLQQEDFIVSKTDTKGVITYCNRDFIKISKYSEYDLIGKQHNIIRHPDMPRSVFKLMWDMISNKQECFAIVKNMSKDGGFYWVYANVTPDIGDNGDVIGF